ncbi:23S rRNA (uracil(1939)-C(5))-methyltransferase RlmD [Bacillus taeanensis]|uniref:23S rRNA (Uracil(1939)-C(5))-methyltransferase RlmD n=1 Tax=Bacillus taeanensis TaxID=273032 RepID=A0A366XR13_9BACI|nr:23S rRNA (uracil(1939)-C(5))-methyltransferase RlmD [Bacillus taeanensis]RBW68146.1 23S rRNA (uracil(1939)-C(5))-methyltransferase RlmD [Bacillus taeanensis]
MKARQKKQDHDIQLKQGQTIPVTIKRLGINGEGVGYYKRKVIFVKGALPGEEVIAEITKPSANHAEANLKKIQKKSQDRVNPPCSIYEQCGGCQLQHLSYEKQLEEKKDIVRQAFERHTNLNPNQLPLKNTIGMNEPWNYRNKSQLQAGKQDDKVIVGLYGEGSHKLIDLSDCMVQHPATNNVTDVVKGILEDLNIPIYNERKRTGVIRTVVTRVGFKTGEIQLVLVTAQKEIPKKELLLEEIKNRLPEVTSVIQNINDKKTSLIFGDESVHLHGKEKISEKLGPISFELSDRAFFQLNPAQTVKLYNAAKRAAKLTGEEKIVDAYCGVGTIGLWLAENAKEIRGMDVIPAAIEDANRNAESHNVKNYKYVVGKAEEWLPKWVKEGWKPDVIVVDPPRTGCDDMFLKTVKKVKSKRFVYVSCNPSTLAKDVQQLLKAGYKLESLQPVDMFPHTAHVEVVASLSLK